MLNLQNPRGGWDIWVLPDIATSDPTFFALFFLFSIIVFVDSSSRIFERYGIWLIKDFFQKTEIQTICKVVRESPGVPSQIYGKRENISIQSEERRSQNLILPSRESNSVRERLLGIITSVEAKFGIPLSGFEGPQFLSYKTGDFFLIHRDLPLHPNNDLQRCISTILFLNTGGGNSRERDFTGGELFVYCSQKDQPRIRARIRFDALAGTLLLFPVAFRHEIKPVTSQERLTAVGWFY